MNDLVTFKLTKEAFSIIFNEGIPFDALKQILIKKIEESAKFFDGIKYKTVLKGRFFSEEELIELKEIIREKILINTQDEIPHSVAITIDKYQESDEIDRIYATIYCEQKSQKGILIGKSGSLLKKIGTEARIELESIVDKKVFLALEVKVEKDWRKKDKLLKNFGYVSEI